MSQRDNLSKKNKRAVGGSSAEGRGSSVKKDAFERSPGRSGKKFSVNQKERYVKKVKTFSGETGISAEEWNMPVAVSVETGEQLKTVLGEKAVSRIYIDEACFGIPGKDAAGNSGKGKAGEHETEALAKIIREIHEAGKEAGLRLRRIERDTDPGLDSMSLLSGLIKLDASPDMLLIRTFDEAMMLSDLETSETGNKGLNHIRKIFDYTCYGYNTEAVSMLKELGAEGLTYPIELNFKECLNLRKAVKELSDKVLSEIPYEMLVYGHLPMMVSANCIRKTSAGCDHKNRFMVLRDRMQKDMPVRCYCKYCYNQIFNAEPLVLYDLPEDVRSLEPECLRYDFSVETGSEIRKILAGAIPKDITRGHFRHGVE
ncbi:U32 family peptidase [Oribacterium sp. P6A1]|uniref:U32 family peptidase n=1 Tax=Oribacterium sp. P6A1 TaxID=1410612 RepID=UPI00069149B4|nr:U32 family peptidase [Oribacterium sp. P6A1]